MVVVVLGLGVLGRRVLGVLVGCLGRAGEWEALCVFGLVSVEQANWRVQVE